MDWTGVFRSRRVLQMGRKSGSNTTGAVGLGFIFYWRIKGTEALKDEFAKFVITTAAPLAFFVTALVIYNLWRAPYLIYGDEQSIVAGKLHDLSVREDADRSAKADAEQKLSREEQTIQKLTEDIKRKREKSNTAFYGSTAPASAVNEQRKQTRNQIAAWLEEGTSIAGSCLKTGEDPALQKTAEDWAKKVCWDCEPRGYTLRALMVRGDSP